MRAKACRTSLYLAIGLIAVSGPAWPDETASMETAKEIFEENCAACHGYDGVPLMAGIPNFTKGERMEKSDSDLLKTIKEGRTITVEGAELEMPPWKDELSDAELKLVLVYVRRLGEGK